MDLLFLLTITCALLLVLRALQQIRDALKFGLVVDGLDEFVKLLSQEERVVVYRKWLRRYQSGKWSYTVVTSDGLVTYFSWTKIEERLPKETMLIARKHKVS